MHKKTIRCKDTGEEVTTYEAYLKTKHWRQLREKVYETYNHECAKCHDIIPLHYANVHHRKYKNLGKENMQDLILYCTNCHAKIHTKKKHVKIENKNFAQIMKLCNYELTQKEKDEIIDFVTKKYFSDKLSRKDMIGLAEKNKNKKSKNQERKLKRQKTS